MRGRPCLHGIGCGDHSNNAHYVSKTADPFDLATDCSVNHHAMFLLLVEEGVFLGSNGWHADYDKPLVRAYAATSNVKMM